MEKNNRDDELMEVGTVKARRLSAVRQRDAHWRVRSGGGREFKTPFESSKDAMVAGLEIKQEYPIIRIEIFNAMERSYAPLALVEGPAKLGGK